MVSHALVLPGGSYRRHAPHEAEPVVAWLAGVGVPASVLRYPVGRPHPAAHRAVGDRVAELRHGGVDRVLLLGFSAGGHAAGLAALQPADASRRVDGVVLGYPVVSLVTNAHPGSSEVLLGGSDTIARRAALSLESLVTAAAPPFFIFHSFDDEKVPVDHALLLSAALRRARAPHELHLYPLGGHGCGLGGDQVPWTQACQAWLVREGWTDGVASPLDTRTVSRQSVETG